jgi:hypothetical protein
MTITLNTDRNRASSPQAALPTMSHTWEEFIKVYPIYAALTRQCGLPDGPYPAVVNPKPWPDIKVRDRDLLWLDEVDRQVQAVHLRQFLAIPGVAREEGLRVFLQRHLLRPKKQISDRDKIDLLIVQYLVLCAPQDLIEGRVEFDNVANVLQPLLGEVETASLECCEPLDRILEAAEQSHSLREMFEQGVMEQGRSVKEDVGGMFYDPVALVSICRFNFVLRRTFIQLLHGDLRAIEAALNKLERRGLQTIDCRRAGFSATEPLEKLRLFHRHWKVPFQTDYKQDSAFRQYEQLMSLREDLEEALGEIPAPFESVSTPAAGKSGSQDTGTTTKSREIGKSPNGADTSAAPSAPRKATPPVKPPAIAAPRAKPPEQPISRPASKTVNPPPEQKNPSVAVADVENFEEKIWEQLIATPPVRGRSMTTVTVEETRILLSAWEVAAFISDSGEDSDILRRLIVARAMLSTAIGHMKQHLDFKMLHRAVTHARSEVPRFQERVDQLKRTLKTDTAVNLGISLKRLLSLVDEAEQLQKGSAAQEGKR